MKTFVRLAIPVVLVVVLCAPSAAGAQVLYGSIVGNVTDGTGSAVPGATVTITNTETGGAHEAVTDSSGAYRFPTVQPGT